MSKSTKTSQSTPISESAISQDLNTGKKTATWILFSISIAAGIYFLNPAVALLGGLATRLALDVNPVPNTGQLGKLSLQTAIVLLGFTLGMDRLISVSAD